MILKELDMSKYLVLKREDLSWLSERERDLFFESIEKIDRSRKRNGKPQNEYLVLNLDENVGTGRADCFSRGGDF